MTTVVPDLQHPSNMLAKPLVSPGPADAGNLRTALDASTVSEGCDLSGEARELLALTMRATELRPDLATA
ncbi:hypothetical protein [Thermobifida halotolerans]|nr:hypothetical protein [Thermobifida halotolerans]